MMNQQIHLVSRPTGEPDASNFKLVEAPVPAQGDLKDGQVLVKNHYLSLDPYMRGRMNDGKSYAQPQLLDTTMGGGTVGEVVASKNPGFAVGDHVVGMGGWQLYSVVDAALPGVLRKVDTSQVPLSAYLGAVGMPGVTAWVGLVTIIDPKPGETVVVSAASGAVGSMVGQLAKARGARAVGIAGGAEKCAYVVEQLGFDACIDHRAHNDFKSMSQALKEACPKGIDGNFENVGGMILDAIMMRSNAFSRVAMCGMISGYNGEPIPLAAPQLILVNRMKVQGFIVSEHMQHWPAALAELGQGIASGKYKHRETRGPGPGRRARGLHGPAQGQELRQAAGQAGLTRVALPLVWTWQRFADLGVDGALRPAGPAGAGLHPRAGPLPRPRRAGPPQLAPAGPRRRGRAACLPARGRPGPEVRRAVDGPGGAGQAAARQRPGRCPGGRRPAPL